MDKVSREQFKELRQMGYSSTVISDFAKRGRISEKLNKQTFSEKGLLRATGEFLNMDEFGRGIGQTIRNVTGETDRVQQGILKQQEESTTSLINAIRKGRAEGRDVSNLLTALESTVEQPGVDFEEMATGGLNNREVLGSAASTALNVASLGGALNFGAKAATGAATVRGAALTGAKSGAISGGLFGAAEATTEGEGALTGAAKGAAFGASVGGVIGGASKYIDDLIKTTPDSRLHETKDIFKTLKRRFNENSVYRKVDGQRKLVSDPISTLTDEGIGTQLRVVDGKINAETARSMVRELIDEQKEEVAEAVANATQQGKNTSLMSLKQAAIERLRSNKDLQARGVVQKTENEVNRIFDDFLGSFGDDLTPNDVNAIRTAMNKVFNADTIDAERAVGDAARRFVYQNAPGSQQALAREGQLIGADKFLDALDGRAVKGGRLGGYFANMVGAIAGSSTDIPVVGPVVGALGANKIQQLAQSQQLNPIIPRITRTIATQIDKLPTDAAGNISRTAVLNLIAQISARPTSEETPEP